MLRMNASGISFGVNTGLPSSQSLLQAYGGSIVIKGILIGILIAVILFTVDMFYPFLPVNPIAKPSAAARAGKTFWKSLPPDAENLIVPESESPTKQANNYSMSFDMMIGDSRGPIQGIYHHVVHRGSNPCGLSVPSAGPSGHNGIQPDDVKMNLSDMEKPYIDTGLPQIMNPGLMLDAYKNDLHIFVHTRGTEDGKPALWLESTTIADLPMNTPLTVGIVCNGRTLEVYLNCKLYTTMILRGAPHLPKTDNQWFGRYCAFPMTGLVKNLRLWPTSLNSDDFITMCRTPSFSGDTVPTAPAVCPQPLKKSA